MTSRPKKKGMAPHASKLAFGAKSADSTEASTERKTRRASTRSTQSGADSLPSSALQESTIRKIAHQLRWRAHWFMPNFIPAPYFDRAYQQARDKKSNEESCVGNDEELRIRALWGVDLFGPNESDRLYEALRQRGWSAGFGEAENGALTWVQQQRTYGHGGDYNVGVVTRSANPQRILGVRNHASLPDDVEYLLVRLHQVVPAVTCVVVCFVLKEAATTRYEQELNLDRVTKRERKARWSVSYFDPTHVKQQATEGVRGDFRRMVSGWFMENFPGYFAHSNLPQRFPTAELLSTRSEDVFAEKPGKTHFDWRKLMANVTAHDVWTSSHTSGLRFVEQQNRWPHERENSLIACASIQSLPQERIRMYGGNEGAIVAICHESIEGCLAYFAINAFLAEVARDLKGSREELSLSKSNRKTIRTIDRIQRFFDRNAGVPAVARELRDLTKTPGHFEHYCEDFTAMPWVSDQPSRQLAKELREHVHFRASALIEDESSTREHFEQLSTILSIRESVRAQRKMEVLTIAALLVASVSFAAAVPDGWTTKLKAVVANVQSASAAGVERFLLLFDAR